MKPKVTHDQIEDLIEFCVNRVKPEIKMKRTVEGLVVTVNRTKFKVRIEKKGKAA